MGQTRIAAQPLAVHTYGTKVSPFTPSYGKLIPCRGLGGDKPEDTEIGKVPRHILVDV